MEPKRKTRAVIFDMDGVIIDSERMHIEAKKKTLAHYGIDFPEEQLPKYAGRSSKEFFCELLDHAGRKDVSVEEITAYKHAAYRALQDKEALPEVPGAVALIKELHAKGLPLALATSSWEGSMNLVLDAFHLRPYFASVLSGATLPKSKPDPAIYLESAQRLGIAPAHCTVVEDAENGILAAHRAGMRVIAYRNPNSGAQDLSLADVIAEHMRDVLQEI